MARNCTSSSMTIVSSSTELPPKESVNTSNISTGSIDEGYNSGILSVNSDSVTEYSQEYVINIEDQVDTAEHILNRLDNKNNDTTMILKK